MVASNKRYAISADITEFIDYFVWKKNSEYNRKDHGEKKANSTPEEFSI